MAPTTTAAVHVRCEVRVIHPPTIPVDDFHGRGAALMDELMGLEDANELITDTTLAGDAGRMTWTIEIVVLTDDQFDGLMTALTTIRTALHALGDATAGWPTAEDVRYFAPSIVSTEATLVPA